MLLGMRIWERKKDLKDLGIRMSTVVRHIREGMHSPLDTQQ